MHDNICIIIVIRISIRIPDRIIIIIPYYQIMCTFLNYYILSTFTNSICWPYRYYIIRVFNIINYKIPILLHYCFIICVQWLKIFVNIELYTLFQNIATTYLGLSISISFILPLNLLLKIFSWSMSYLLICSKAKISLFYLQKVLNYLMLRCFEFCFYLQKFEPLTF